MKRDAAALPRRPRHRRRGIVAIVLTQFAVTALAIALAAPVVATTSATASLVTPPFSSHLTRAPYLTDLVGLHVAVNFATDRSATKATVEYGTNSASSGCTLNHSAVPTRRAISVGTVREYQWTANLTLSASGDYCYRVFLAGTDLLGVNPSPSFLTQVQPGQLTPMTFDVLGDWGLKSNPYEPALMAQIASSGARFAVTVGDNGYPNGSESDYGDLQQTGTTTGGVFGPNMWTSAGDHIPLFTAVGNHGITGVAHTDITTWTEAVAVADSGGTYQNTDYCCVDGTTSENLTSEWYAFTAGNTRFYVLDAAWADTNPGTNGVYASDAAAHWAPTSPEYKWLVADLHSHPTQLKLAFFHYPLYSDVHNAGSDTYLDGTGNLEGLLARNGVQMVFNGHAHVYERHAPSAPGMPVTYVTGEGGGTPEVPECAAFDAYGIGWNAVSGRGHACGAASTPTSEAQVFSFLKVTIEGTTVSVIPTNSLGQTFDAQTYSFVAPPDTYIDSAPPALTTQATATISFHATSPTASYSCTLDGAPAKLCTSPDSFSALADGAHTFTVAATVGGTVDPSPAEVKWTVDTTPPSVPTGLSATEPTATQVQLHWSASTDSSGISGYRVFRDGILYRTIGATTSFTDAVAAGSSHSYAVAAVDSAGNVSQKSTAVTASTGGSSASVFSDGFESGTLASWTTTHGLNVESTLVAAGNYAAQSAPGAATGSAYAKKTLPATFADGYLGAEINIGTQTGQVNILRLRSSSGASLAYVYATSAGRVGVHNDVAGTTVTSTTVLNPGWHLVQLRLADDSAAGTATGALQVWIDNTPVTVLSSSAVDTGSQPIAQIQIGETQAGRGYPVTYDNVGFGTTLASGS